MIADEQSDPKLIEPTVALPAEKEDLMTETSERARQKRELAEECFLEQFAALEDSLALLQAQMQSMSDNAKRFGSLAQQIRRSTCPATGHQHKTRADCRLGQRSN